MMYYVWTVQDKEVDLDKTPFSGMLVTAAQRCKLSSPGIVSFDP